MKLHQLAKQNKGFSLVEIIIVVAILGICLGLLSTSISIVPAREARRCANELDAALSRCKMECLAKTSHKMILTCKDDGYYITQQTGTNSAAEEKIANRRCTVSFKTDTGTVVFAGTVDFSFNFSTGALKVVKSDGSNYDIKEILISGGGRTYKITLYAKTGTHILEGA